MFTSYNWLKQYDYFFCLTEDEIQHNLFLCDTMLHAKTKTEISIPKAVI